MREVNIFNTGNNFFITAVRDDGQRFTFETVPSELETVIKDILDFADSQKTDQERATEKAAAYLAETASIEKQLELIDVFPTWSEGVVVQEGDQYQHKGKLYRALQTHKALDIWPPDKVESMFLCLSPVEEAEQVQPWRQPTGAHDAYKLGDEMVWTDGKTYVSKINANTYSPTVYPPGWEVKQ